LQKPSRDGCLPRKSIGEWPRWFRLKEDVVTLHKMEDAIKDIKAEPGI
jgi:hypothetical protein